MVHIAWPSTHQRYRLQRCQVSQVTQDGQRTIGGACLSRSRRHHGRTLRNPTSVLADDGSIINKRALGRVSFNAAIKLSDDTEVEQAVHLAPNVEVDLAEMAGGPRPLWVIPSEDGIANFPTLAGVEVTVIER
jgi:hypothetical protein